MIFGAANGRAAQPQQGRTRVHPVLTTVLKRFGLGLVTLFVVSVIIFSAINALPGDFGQAVLGQSATKETVAAFRQELGLDQPATVRYLHWVASIATGDLGTSFSGRASSGVDRSRQVIDLIAPWLKNTLFLASMTAAIAVPLALFLGVTSALWRNSRYDKGASVGTLTTISFPEFFVAYILILFFGTLWPVFPLLANIRPEMSFGDHIHTSILPAMTPTLVIVAHMMRMGDVIKVMRHGVEVEEAETREMLANPKQDYTKTLWWVRRLRKPAEKSDDIVLSIDSVDAAYGTTKVLEDVSIRLPRGKTVAIVGESGSGKSTGARVVTALLPASHCQVEFNGTSLPAALKQRSKDQLCRIQMIYQMADTAMNPRQCVAEIIARPLEFYHGLRDAAQEARVIELLDQIELGETFLDRLPAELSGGQKQRVSIARALAAKPDIIICDEVTLALDQIVQEGFLRLFLRLQKESGISYLFITHDIATVEAISDETVVMHKGRVVEQGSKDEVLSPPYPEYTRKPLASVPAMDPDWLTNLTAQIA